MMKDTPDGQTHFYGDSCIPPHIQQNTCENYNCPHNHPHPDKCDIQLCPVHSTPTQPEWMKGLREEWAKYYIWFRASGMHQAPDMIKGIEDFWLSKFSTTIQKEIERERVKVKNNIGFLRQWLNEKPADRLVTNEDIEHWLFQEFIKNKR